MKTDEVNMNRQTTLEKSDHKKQTPIIISILPLLSMLAAVLPSAFKHTNGIDIVKTGIITLLLTLALSFYIKMNADGILNKMMAKTIITLGYLGSIGLLLFVPEAATFSFWMLGGLVISMLIDNKLGLFIHFNLCFIMGIMLVKSPEQVIQMMLIGILLSMFAETLKNKSTIIYAAVIILSMNMTLSFVIHNLIISKKTSYNYLFSMLSILAVLMIAYLINRIYNRHGEFSTEESTFDLEKHVLGFNIGIVPTSSTLAGLSESKKTLHNKKKSTKSSEDKIIDMNSNNIDTNSNSIVSNINTIETENQRNQLDNSVTETSNKNDFSGDEWTSYEVLCDLNNALIQKMKQHSDILYSHALHIGDLSMRAAKEICANEKLALAGGIYHEVGKLYGKNYIEEGQIIAEEYRFPKELRQVMMQHNIKYDKPKSIEAAIVMLSDSVVSTVEYIEKSGDNRFTTNKVIENAFQMRMDKGTFDLASISLKDYKCLKDFFIKEFVITEI